MPTTSNTQSNGQADRFSKSDVVRHTVAPLFVVLLGIGGYWCLASMRSLPTVKQDEPQAPLVETAVVSPVRTSVPIHFHGTVVPKREVALVAELAGTVVEKNPSVRAGSFVKRGQVLFRIDPTRYELEVKRAESELKQVEADVKQLELEETNNHKLLQLAQQELEIAERELERLDQLAKRNAASESQRDQVASQRMKSRNALQTIENAQRLVTTRRDRLRAMVELSSTRVRAAQLDLEKTSIAAPFDGLVVKDHAEKDTFVQPGTVLAELEDTSAVEVRCHLRAEDLEWLWNSAEGRSSRSDSGESPFAVPPIPAQVTYSIAGKEYEWAGKLKRFEGIGVDERTRTVPCRIEVPRPVRTDVDGGPPALVRGMFVKVALSATPAKSLLELPVPAVRPGPEVWTIQADGILKIEKPRIVRTLPETVLIDAGSSAIRAGMKVVTSPLGFPVEGMKLRERPGL
jgi:multidrug efflux pump subunit AcrA (membrane-fusion protein)